MISDFNYKTNADQDKSTFESPVTNDKCSGLTNKYV